MYKFMRVILQIVSYFILISAAILIVPFFCWLTTGKLFIALWEETTLHSSLLLPLNEVEEKINMVSLDPQVRLERILDTVLPQVVVNNDKDCKDATLAKIDTLETIAHQLNERCEEPHIADLIECFNYARSLLWHFSGKKNVSVGYVR